ncbi:MAG TPA: hypothetical protein VEC57_17900 [Candidatus Limnocylindrales bacterium]|nr:hypothetical protein [Candidatus Limnocylindrales bacterium]
MAVHESFWTYARFRWLKLSLVVLAASSTAYVMSGPVHARSGDSAVGYGLGIVAAALMAWLSWFGVRKRSYHAAGAPLRGWLSAHVYLGACLLLLVPLHCAFQFGANIHTAAYALVVAVVVSGIAGVAYYTAIPERMTENRPGEKLAALLEHIAEIDSECRSMAESLPDAVARAIRVSIEETRLGGGLLRQLSGTDPRCGTARALAMLSAEAAQTEGSRRGEVQRLLEILSIKRSLVDRVRKDGRYKALLDLWLTFHVPLAMASLVAVAAHVFVVLYHG